MTLTIVLLIIILIGVYLNFYINWKSAQNLKSKEFENNNKLLSIYTTTLESNSNSFNTPENKNLAIEDYVYKPIAKYAEYYEPCFIQTLSEKNVFLALIRVLSSYNIYIFPQVSFACIVTGKNETYDSINFNRIAKKRVDYAIVNHYGETLFIIELDGDSHNQSDKTPYVEERYLQGEKDKDRDEF